MPWWWPFGRGGEAALATGDGADLSDFQRASWSFGQLTAGDVVTLGSYGMGCRPETHPQQVPLEVLDAMGWHPVIYAGESLMTAPATDPELYYLRAGPGADAKTVAEVEAWLGPLLRLQRAPLLEQVVRAFGFGAVPIVLDYVVRTLQFETDGKGATVMDPIPGHVHYGASHEVWPGDVEIQTEGDRLVGMRYGSVVYGGEDLEDAGRARAFLAIWGPQFGRWLGQGARRRAYKAWIEEGMGSLWEIRYLERAVDLPRVGFAPDEDLTIAGQKVPAIKLLRAQLMALRNGSAMVLPSTQVDGKPAYDVRVLDVPDRHETFKNAITMRGVRMLEATLVPGGSLDKANEEQFMDAVQRVCDFVARFLTRVVNTALRVRYGIESPIVYVVANDIPKRKLRLVQQVFANAANATQYMPDGRVYTLAELVDPEILDQLGVKARPVETAAHAPAAPESIAEAFGSTEPGKPPGRPIDVAGGREERRDDAETVEGEADTGGEDVERTEQERPQA
jgi:hypothetical protein